MFNKNMNRKEDTFSNYSPISPIISVIVPVYNVEKYISRCIESILGQSHSALELILVDDGSSDSSGAICDEYARKDSRTRVIHKENGGVSSARNEGIKKAQGDWLCFVDGDDYVECDYLENFQLNGWCNELYAQGYRIQYGENCKKVDIEGIDLLGTNDLVLALEENNILNSPCFKLFNASVVKEYGILFNQEMSYGEDHLFTLQFMHYVNGVKYNHGSKYVYFQEDVGSLTRKIINPSCYIKYINEIVPEIKSLGEKFLLDDYKTRVIINRRVHFHIHRAAINYARCKCDKAILRQIQTTLKKNINGNDGLSSQQILFVKILLVTNTSLLSWMLKINNKLGLSKKIKIGL